jgi:hypothetical protein
MSLNHILLSTVPDDEALNVKFNNVTVNGTLDFSANSESFYGSLDPTIAEPFSVQGYGNNGGLFILGASCTSAIQIDRAFNLGYDITIQMPANVTENSVSITCPYPDALQSLISKDPTIINGSKWTSMGYAFSDSSPVVNPATLRYSVQTDITVANPLTHVTFQFYTDNGQPFTSGILNYRFRIMHSQAA